MTATTNVSKEEGSKGYHLLQKEAKEIATRKEFQNRHQLLAWRQYSAIEHGWYKIHEMDLGHNVLFVERLFDTEHSHTNGKVLHWVTASARVRGGSV